MSKETVIEVLDAVDAIEGNEELVAYIEERLRVLIRENEVDDFESQRKIIDYQAKVAGHLCEYEMKNAVAVEMFKASVDYGKNALNSIMLINILGVFVSYFFIVLAGISALPLFVFGTGVLLASGASGFAYLGQSYFSTGLSKVANIFRCFSIGIFLLSLLHFIIGLVKLAAFIGV